MQIDLSGRRALVTGSTEGIGFAIARGLAAAGAQVVVNGRDQDKTVAAVQRLEAEFGVRAEAAAADLGNAEGCDDLVEQVADVDILINNLGTYGMEDFFVTSDATWERFFQVNVMSGVRLSRAYLPHMQTQNWGRVVFISSESAFNIPPDMIHYGMSKTAQVSIARGLAKRMAGTGVTVNSVLPGPTLSDGLKRALAPLAAQQGESVEALATGFVHRARPSSIIQRPATVEEVANMVVYVASPQASATTGAALRVDGGVVDMIV